MLVSVNHGSAVPIVRDEFNVVRSVYSILDSEEGYIAA